MAVRLNAGHLDGSPSCASIILTLLRFLMDCRRGLVRLPEHFRRAELAADPAAPDAKGVAQPAQVADRFRRNFFLSSQRDTDPLRPQTDGAAEGKLHDGAATTRPNAQ